MPGYPVLMLIRNLAVIVVAGAGNDTCNAVDAPVEKGGAWRKPDPGPTPKARVSGHSARNGWAPALLARKRIR
ncbi:MAG: hypothetical protein NVSMB22_19710 [Chloroflexota bacterium]